MQGIMRWVSNLRMLCGLVIVLVGWTLTGITDPPQMGCLRNVKALGNCALKYGENQDVTGLVSCVTNFVETCNVRTKQPEDTPPIRINKESLFLEKLGSEGWRVDISPEILKEKCPNEVIYETNESTGELRSTVNAPKPSLECIEKVFQDMRGCFVVFISTFNAGKTHLLNKITGQNFPTGYGGHGETKGINIYYEKSTNTFYIDGEGMGRAESPANKKSRFLTDTFIESWLPIIGNKIVIVTDNLQTQDQVYLDKIISQVKMYSAINPGDAKKVFVIHNFKTFHDPSDVKSRIETDIIRAFGAKEKNMKRNKGTYWTHQYEDSHITVNHYVYAAEHTEAGRMYNENTIALLQNEFDLCEAQTVDNLLDSLKGTLQGLLRDYFHTNATQATNVMNPPKPGPWDFLAKPFTWMGRKFGVMRPESVKKPPVTEMQNDPMCLKLRDDNGVVKLATCEERELVYYRTEKFGEIPQVSPKLPCSAVRSAKQFTVQCVVPFGQLCKTHVLPGWSVTENCTTAALVRFEDESGLSQTQIVITGYIPPLWTHHKNFIPSEWELVYADGVTHGAVEKRFAIPQHCINPDDRMYADYRHGVITVSMPCDQYAKVSNEMDG